MKNIKIKETYLLFLIVIGLISIATYSTYALFTASTTINDVVEFQATLTTDSNVLEYESVTVPAGETKTIEINLSNSYQSSLYYGAWYEIIRPEDTSSVRVGIYTEENNTASSGQIPAGTTLTLLVGIANDSTEEAIVNVGTVGSITTSLNLSENRTILPAGWSPVTSDLIIDNMPVSTGTYTVDTTNCTSATMTYDYLKKGFKVSNVSLAANAKCSPIVTQTTRTTFATYIKNLLGTNTSVVSTRDPNNPDGSTLEKITDNGEDDYRYRGINPNNYVMFNNELWRIIGVFDDNTHSITDTHLIKIIRNDSLGQYIWDDSSTNGRNNFPTSDIYNMLTAYYNHSDATEQEFCYSENKGTPRKANCDFTKIGIQTEYQNMVDTTVNWFLGGYSYSSQKSNAMYKYERSTTKYSQNYATTSAAGIIVPVALMYASDYGYAAPSTCTTTLLGYDNEGCADSNWLKSNYYEWTLTHKSSYSYTVFQIQSDGSLDVGGSKFVNSGFEVRPTLYLKSNVYYVSGTGTTNDPYIIAID